MRSQERPSVASRANAVAQLIVSTGAGWLAESVFPPNATGIGVKLAAAALGTGVGVAAVVGWNRLYAPLFVNLNHQADQRLYIVPWEEGYVVAQPRHRWQFTPGTHWRQMRDIETPHLYSLAGYVATEPLAQELCRNRSGEWGTVLTPPGAMAGQRQFIQDVVEAARARYGTRPPREMVELQHWDIARIPAPSDSHHPERYVAVRRVMTRDGPRWEFYPQPPRSDGDTSHLKSALETIATNHSRLDSRVLDPALVDALTSDQRKAWTMQSGSWTTVSLDPDSAHSTRWCGVQRDDHGRITQWEPSPPDTFASSSAVDQHVRRWLAPGAPRPLETVCADESDLVAQWYAQVVATTGLSLAPAQPIAPQHPLVAMLHVTYPAEGPQWRIVSQVTEHGARWMALCVYRDATTVRVAPVMTPGDATKIWLTDSPTPLRQAVAAQQRTEDLLTLSEPFPLLVSAPRPTPSIPRPHASLGGPKI